MRYTAKVGDRVIAVGVEDDGQVRSVTLDGTPLTLAWTAAGADGAIADALDPMAGHYGLLAGSHSYEVFIRPLAESDEETGGQVYEVLIDGRSYRVTLQDERTRTLQSLVGGAHATGEVTLRAPMPGLVVNVMVNTGDHVRRGQTVAVLQAMKMENDLPSPREGTVKAVRVQGGQTVNQNDVLAIIGDEAGTALEGDDGK